MEERILSTVAAGIIGELGKAAVKEIASLWGVEDELQQLGDTITAIKSVLVDAEKQQVQNQQIKTWLGRLEDAVYEADDLVDEFLTEALRRQVMTGNTMAKQVRIFCSSSNQFAFRHKMGRNIRDLRKKLDKIAADRQKFNLETGLLDTQVVIGKWEEHSYVRDENVIGRDEEKKEIIKRLFNMKTKEKIGVIPIVGVGGLGKTTLAQLVYNDAEVRKHFELVMWVSVPKVFDVKLIVRQMVESEVKEKGSSENISMDKLQKDLREKINGKQFLIVLDDVWDIENENREKWLELENLIRDGANGSRIIVTTRSEKVAHIINGSQQIAYFLNTLNEKKSWALFKKLAFRQGQEPDDPNLVEIGKEIMRSCGGIPLVIRTIGSMLFSLDKKEWRFLKEKELLGIPQYEKDIIPRLKLSYDNLPSHLKNCFAYCSLFPKNHIIDVQDLINLWMAQGFIQLSNQHQHPEDIGYQYFKALLYRSFFEKVRNGDCVEDITHYKIHDCMHDLAMSVVGTQSIMLNLNDGDDNKIDTKTRHVSFNYDVRPQPALLVKAKRIRTILLPNNTTYYWLRRQRIFVRSINKIELNFKFLRTLELYGENMEIIPNSIGKLKHLRYLNLSYNEKVKALPDCITSLQNLQTLILFRCQNLRTLPRDITKLVNLRHLDIKYCNELSHMPHGISQMTNLQRLTQFSLREKLEGSGQLNELKNLNSLRGHLQIVVGKDGIECRGANLKNKQYLQSLELNIQGRMVDECEDDLVPHPNLKELYLKGPYVSDVLLNCVPSLHNLVIFELWGHKGCRYVGALNHLPNLKVLWLRDLPALEYISSDDNIVDGTSSPFFPSLLRLWLTNLRNLKGWWKLDDDVENTTMRPFFSRLSDLSVWDCPNLISMPRFPNLQEELDLQDTNIKTLEETLKMKMNVKGGGEATSESDQPSSSTSYSSSALVSHSTSFIPLSNLKALYIRRCSDLHRLAVGFKNLTSLKELVIEGCSKLQTLYSCLHHLTSLQQLHIGRCREFNMSNGIHEILWKDLASLSHLTLNGLPELVSLPQGLQQVTTLQEIKISYCNNLESVLECVSNLKSLNKLSMKKCPKLKSLPEGMYSLTSLQKLKIKDCPILLERCREDIDGDYWPKIRHIQELVLFPKPKVKPAEEQREPDRQEESTSSKTCGLFNCAKIFKH